MPLTPYTDDLQIDAVALGRMLDAAYADAGRQPEDVDTGVVILTGEALRRRNAERIASVVAERAGDLVCATAGHHMEAMLAAYGSGAALTSHEAGQPDPQCRYRRREQRNSRSSTAAGCLPPPRCTSVGD